MSSFDGFLSALDHTDVRHLTLVLLLYTHNRHPQHDPGALVQRAFDEALNGKHKRLLEPGMSPRDYLAAVIDAIA